MESLNEARIEHLKQALRSKFIEEFSYALAPNATIAAPIELDHLIDQRLAEIPQKTSKQIENKIKLFEKMEAVIASPNESLQSLRFKVGGEVFADRVRAIAASAINDANTAADPKHASEGDDPHGDYSGNPKRQAGGGHRNIRSTRGLGG